MRGYAERFEARDSLWRVHHIMTEQRAWAIVTVEEVDDRVDRLWQ